MNILLNFRKAVIQRRPVLRCNRQNRAVFLCIMQFTDDGFHSCFPLGIAITEILKCIFIIIFMLFPILISMSALCNGIHMRLNATAEKAAIILTPFHHHCKICQLICSPVNIQTINIMLYDFKRCFPLIVSCTFINIHQHIEHCNQDMSTSHTWIDTGNICRLQFFVGGTDFCQFYINSFFLLCLWKIIFPSKSLRSCFFVCAWIYSP